MGKKKLIGIVGACIVVVVAVLIATNLSAPAATIVTLDDGASISVPRGAVSSDASVNATALDPENGPEPPPGFTIESLYEFDIDEPPTEPVTLRLPLPSIAEDSACWLAKYDESAGTWRGVAFAVDDDYAVVQTDTLSVYATMTGAWDDFASWARETAGDVGSWARNQLAGLNLDNWISRYEDVMGADEMIYDPLTATSPELKCDDSASRGLISASAVLVGENDIEIRVRNNGKMYLQLYFDGPRVEPVKRGYLALTDLLEFVETTPEMKSLVKNSFQTNSVILLPESTADFRAYMNEGESLTIRAEFSDAAALLNSLDPAFALVPVVDLEVVTAVRDVKGAESDFYQALTAYEGEWMVQTYYALNIVEEMLRAGWLVGSDVVKSIASAYLLEVPTAAEIADESLDRAEDIVDKGADALSGGTIIVRFVSLGSGELIPGFGASGTVTGNPGTGRGWARSIAIDSTAMYVIGLDEIPGNRQWRIEKRSLTDGILVSGFGTGGVVTTNPSWGVDDANGMAIDSTAMYVVGRDEIPGNWQWRIEKRNLTDGKLVTGFGTGGVVTNNPSTGMDDADGIAIDSTAMYVIGTDEIPGNWEWRIEKRSLTDGSLVSEFGTGGVITSNPRRTYNCPIAIAIDTTAMYVVGREGWQWRIEKRSLTDGSLVSGFGTGGVITGNPSTDLNHPCGIAIDSTAMYVVGVDSSPGNWEWRIEKRSLTDGSLVSGFGTGGVITNNPGTGLDAALGIAIGSTAMYVVGTDEIPGNRQWRIEKRSLTDGTLVSEFGTGGVITSNPSTSADGAYAIAIDSTAIYVVGTPWRIEKRVK
jgi:hypothetical protein